jgi:Tol biopolymer transport system component
LPEEYDYYGPSQSANGLTLYFAASKPEEDDDIYVAARATRNERFGAAVALKEINTAEADGSPYIGRDGLTLYFYSSRPGGSGGRDLYLAERATADAAFGDVRRLNMLNGPDDDYLPWVSADGLTLVFSSTRSGSSDLFAATRLNGYGAFSTPDELKGVNTSDREDRAALTSDGLTVYFISDRPHGIGDKDIWVAKRPNERSAFANAKVLETVNSEARDIDVSLSADDRELFFVSKRSGRFRIYHSVLDCR